MDMEDKGNLLDLNPSFDESAYDENDSSDDGDDSNITDTEEATERLDELNKDVTRKKKSNDSSRQKSSPKKEQNEQKIKLKYIETAQNKIFYPIAVNEFVHFENLLFDIMGFTDKSIRLEETYRNVTVTHPKEFDRSEYSSAFISDANILNDGPKGFKKNSFHSRKTLPSDETKSNGSNSKSDKNPIVAVQKVTNNVAKIITIIATQSPRPRKAVRILINRKNASNSMDVLLNEICLLFKMEQHTSKKLFNYLGNQVTDHKELFEHESFLFFSVNENIHGKDLELDLEETKLIFANEYLEMSPNFKTLNLAESYLNKKMSAPNKRSKQVINQLGDDSKINDDLDSIPDDLLNNYEVGDVIGEGHYASVRECKDIGTGLTFALKIIDLRKCQGREDMIENELNILRKVKHINIIKLVEEYRSEHYVYMIMELFKAGDLLDALTNCTKYTETDASVMVFNMASAIAYLHSLNIVHRDIKLENILIHKYSDGSKCLKLGDFGLAIKVDGPITQKCGSPVYVAPEILDGKSYGLEVDVWNLGIITYILLCGFAPFQGENDAETFQAIRKAELKFPDLYWKEISSEAKSLVEKMLDRNQETRIKASDVLKEPWLLKNTANLRDVSPGKQSARLDHSMKDLKSTPHRDRRIDSTHKAPAPEKAPVETDLHDNVSKNLAEKFHRSNYRASNILVANTSLDKKLISVPNTPVKTTKK